MTTAPARPRRRRATTCSTSTQRRRRAVALDLWRQDHHLPAAGRGGAEEARRTICPQARGPWTASAPLPGGDFPPDGRARLAASLAARYRFLDERAAARLACAPMATRRRRFWGDARRPEDLGPRLRRGTERSGSALSHGQGMGAATPRTCCGDARSSACSCRRTRRRRSRPTCGRRASRRGSAPRVRDGRARAVSVALEHVSKIVGRETHIADVSIAL